jgi:hypothetical protein
VKFAEVREFIEKFKGVSVHVTAELVGLCSNPEYGDAFEAVYQLAKNHSNVQMSAELVELCKENPSAFKNLQKFAKVNPNVKITPAIVTLFAREPGITGKIASMGAVNCTYESFAEQKGEGAEMVLNYGCAGYEHDVVCSAANALFAADDVTDDMAKKFLKHGNKLGLFFTDGLTRSEIPNMILPKNVCVIGNGKKDREKFYKEIGKTYIGNEDEFRRDYLRYLAGKFIQAYGENAKNAFYVYMQNFTGSGNSISCISLLTNRYTVPDFRREGVDLLEQWAPRPVTMVMDENFNATYDVVCDMSWTREIADSIEEKKVEKFYPEWYDENAVMVATVRTHIPAAHNPGVSDSYDQRGQKGKQETHMSFIASHPPVWRRSLRKRSPQK